MQGQKCGKARVSRTSTRLALLAALMLALTPVAAGEVVPATSAAPRDQDRAELEAAIGQMILIGFPGANPRDEWPRRVAALIRKGRIGGVILFADNVASPKQLKALTGALVRASPGPPPFIAIDQEGGQIQRLIRSKGFVTTPSAKRLAATDRVTAYEAYEKTAKQLARLGINVNFGPVVDLDVNPRSPAIGRKQRSYGLDPAMVIAFARQFILAHRRAGILTAAKHFPGHGSAATDPHKEPVNISDTWLEAELDPFRDLARGETVDMVMVGHLVHPRFSEAGRPASLSARAIKGVLRGELGFKGLVITDDLAMAAIRSRYSIEEAAVMAVEAGADLLIFADHEKPDGEIADRIIAAIAKAVHEGRIKRSAIDESYRRILAAKAKLTPAPAVPDYIAALPTLVVRLAAFLFPSPNECCLRPN